MDVGIQMVFASYGWDDIKDSEVYRQEVRLAQLADELGFDVLWSAEHHFSITHSVLTMSCCCRMSRDSLQHASSGGNGRRDPSLERPTTSCRKDLAAGSSDSRTSPFRYRAWLVAP